MTNKGGILNIYYVNWKIKEFTPNRIRGVAQDHEKAEKPSVYKAFRTSPTASDKVLIRIRSTAIILRTEWLESKE